MKTIKELKEEIELLQAHPDLADRTMAMDVLARDEARRALEEARAAAVAHSVAEAKARAAWDAAWEAWAIEHDTDATEQQKEDALALAQMKAKAALE